MGAELIGMSDPVADAEIISLAARGVIKQGLNNWKLVIGHTGLVRHLLASCGLDRRTERFLLNHLTSLRDPVSGKEFILEEFDRNLMGASIPADNDVQALDLTEIGTRRMLDVLLDASQHGMTMGGRTQHDIARRLLRKHQRFTERQQVVAALELLEKWVAISASPAEAFTTVEKLLSADDEMGFRLLSNWRTGVNLLTSYDIDLDQVVIQPHVARNWDYYTGIVFEIATNNGARLAGGGRYDELVSLVGGKPVPAVGFAYYLDQMFSAVEPESPGASELLVIEVNAQNRQAASQLAFALRSHDIAVVLTDKRHPDERAISVASDGHTQLNGKSYSSTETAALIAEILAGNV
jgi:histidyl-tRNA synthetase